MLRFMDSCAHLASADIYGKWTAGSGTSMRTAGGRWGGRCLRVYSGWCGRTMDNQERWYTAFALCTSADVNSEIIQLKQGGSRQVELCQQAGNRLAVTRNGVLILGPTPSNVFSLNTWFHLQFYARIHPTAGEVAVKLNNVTVLSGTNLNTRATANSYADEFQLTAATVNHDYQDIWIADAQGAVNNALPGDLRVHALVSNGAGQYSLWTPSGGENWQCVDEIPPNADTDYVRTDTAEARDSYAFEDIPTAGPIKGVQLNLWARKDDAGTRILRTLVRIAGNNYSGSNRSLSDSYRDEMQIYDQSPASGADWTVSEINGAEFGVELVS